MVWGAISCSSSLHLICIDERITSETYCHMFENDFFNQTEDQLPENFLWMHDNTIPHTAAATKAYLEERGINVITWPALSPDLNLIENIWGIMCQKLYANGKSYCNTNELWEVIVQTWHSLSIQVFWNLYNSMQRRMAQVLESNGRESAIKSKEIKKSVQLKDVVTKFCPSSQPLSHQKSYSAKFG